MSDIHPQMQTFLLQHGHVAAAFVALQCRHKQRFRVG
jgi:hypothetical protein